jgi:hypothetical protein
MRRSRRRNQSPSSRECQELPRDKHGRPMNEVLVPTRKDIAPEFERGFAGMTDEPVDLEELIAARQALIGAIVASMPDRHRRFLVFFECGELDRPPLGVDRAERLPAVRWRQQNLDRLSREARAMLVTRLKSVLNAYQRTRKCSAYDPWMNKAVISWLQAWVCFRALARGMCGIRTSAET